ncbi:type II toxin-antitoxin system HicB family antitoxin [Levilactobacillus fuyuanensis]|uniref:Type II toxin-antitoxin system HicB family antitoxin n=1 Tax=Levilactobacillus fuyuanensis TaxID=2486022 RepID=A0ABW4H2A1_9LACO|nr:type II toxin-antitoxin system HicB family antitoxin [Levilactobacillus fuyuanensis]
MNPQNVVVYPIVLHPEDAGGYSVEIPDVGNSWPQGDNALEALEMAQDLIGTMLVNKSTFPPATPFESLTVSSPAIKTLVEVDMLALRKNHTHIVRKNVSIPEYLNELGKKQGLNFSEVLTEALHDKLNA